MLRNKKFLQKGVGLSKLINFRTVSNYLKKTRVIVNILVCIYRKYDDLRKNMNAYSNCNNSLSVGDIIKFGNYFINDNKTKEPIEWRVLEVSNDRALLITKDAIDCKPYNNESRNITWEECSLRQWLNNEFINQAFSKEEQNEIILTNISNPNNTYFEKWSGKKAWGGNNTKDKIFLLSIDEAEKYFKGIKDTVCKATNYAKQQRAYTADFHERLGIGNCCWWLRSPGDSQYHAEPPKDFLLSFFIRGPVVGQYRAAFVHSDGTICDIGLNVDCIKFAVRPALYINLYIGDEKMKCPKCGKIWSDFNSIASNTYICPYCGDNFALDGEVREDISQILKKLVEDFGKDVLLDVSRTNALLMDYAPHSKKERKLIVMVMKEGILSQLLCLANKTDDEKKFGINKCIKQLMSDIWITEDAARYAITVLANAVGVVSSVTQSRPMILTRHPNTSTEPESSNLDVQTESPEIIKLRRIMDDAIWQGAILMHCRRHSVKFNLSPLQLQELEKLDVEISNIRENTGRFDCKLLMKKYLLLDSYNIPDIGGVYNDEIISKNFPMDLLRMILIKKGNNTNNLLKTQMINKLNSYDRTVLAFTMVSSKTWGPHV